jgi:hypothetical protein
MVLIEDLQASGPLKELSELTGGKRIQFITNAKSRCALDQCEKKTTNAASRARKA